MKRLLSAVLLIPIILYAVMWGHPFVFLAVLSAVALLCQYEYAGIVEQYGIQGPGPLGYGAGLLLLLVPGQELAVLVAVALIALTISASNGHFVKGLPRAAALTFGVIYIFGCWKFGALLREVSPHWLMFTLALNWIGDTAAYYVGRSLGRHKLAPRVSPSKTWEGTVASAIAAVLFGILYLPYFVPVVAMPVAAGIALVANIAGQVGDLAESALKRGANVKDSSALLPGHGGWLDRVDSSLFSMPVVYAAVRLFYHA
ncbi:MAG: phosphatidate cytidylyltransferase [Bryobacteraceae bacterium]